MTLEDQIHENPEHRGILRRRRTPNEFVAPGAEVVESRTKIGRRGQPLQVREPLPGAEDVE